jgi:hypothetical protein
LAETVQGLIASRTEELRAAASASVEVGEELEGMTVAKAGAERTLAGSESGRNRCRAY